MEKKKIFLEIRELWGFCVNFVNRWLFLTNHKDIKKLWKFCINLINYLVIFKINNLSFLLVLIIFIVLTIFILFYFVTIKLSLNLNILSFYPILILSIYLAGLSSLIDTKNSIKKEIKISEEGRVKKFKNSLKSTKRFYSKNNTLLGLNSSKLLTVSKVTVNEKDVGKLNLNNKEVYVNKSVVELGYIPYVKSNLLNSYFSGLDSNKLIEPKLGRMFEKYSSHPNIINIFPILEKNKNGSFLPTGEELTLGRNLTSVNMVNYLKLNELKTVTKVQKIQEEKINVDKEPLIIEENKDVCLVSSYIKENIKFPNYKDLTHWNDEKISYITDVYIIPGYIMDSLFDLDKIEYLNIVDLLKIEKKFLNQSELFIKEIIEKNNDYTLLNDCDILDNTTIIFDFDDKFD